MGQRPRDWSPVADSDPVPGDPYAVASVGKKMRTTADDIQRQVRNLKAAISVEAWDSDAGQEFRSKADGAVGKLEAAYKRYDTAADALGTRVGAATKQDYASQLHHAQEIADGARSKARSAEGRKDTAEKKLEHGSDDEEHKAGKKKHESDRDGAEDEIEAARKEIEHAKKVRDDAARKARNAIHGVIEDDALTDSGWDVALDSISKALGTVASVLGVASLLVGWIPVIGQALAAVLGAVAMVASLVSFACTAVLAMRGHRSLTDVALAGVGFLMMGVGKAFTKVAGKFVKSSLPRLQRAQSRSKPMRRDRQKVNQAAYKSTSLSGKDVASSFREPFASVFTKTGWKGTADSARTLLKRQNYTAAREQVASKGGVLKSFSLADSTVAADLKSVKSMSGKVSGGIPAANVMSGRASALTWTGVGLSGGNLALNPTINPYAPSNVL